MITEKELEECSRVLWVLSSERGTEYLVKMAKWAGDYGEKLLTHIHDLQTINSSIGKENECLRDLYNRLSTRMTEANEALRQASMILRSLKIEPSPHNEVAAAWLEQYDAQV